MLMAVLAIMTVTLTACPDDPDTREESNSIVGSWVGTAKYDDGSSESFNYVFKADGTCSAKYWSGGVNDFDEDDFGVSFGHYTYDESIEVLRMEGVDEEGDSYYDYFSCKISGDVMIWDDEIWGGKVILTRKK